MWQEILVQRGATQNVRVSTKDCHFTVMGVIALTGDPMMCVLVLKGVREEGCVEIGLDKFAEVFDQVNDLDYVFINSAPGKVLL